MVNELKALLYRKSEVMKYEHLDKLLSIEIEGCTCLESHMAIMNGIHGRLTSDMDYWMTDSFAIDRVLHLLPPVYKDVVLGFVMRGELPSMKS